MISNKFIFKIADLLTEKEEEAKTYAAHKRLVDPIDYRNSKRFKSGVSTGEIVAHIDLCDEDEGGSSEMYNVPK